MKQRGIFSITTLVLLALQEKPLTKTRLMQELVLSYNRVTKYCTFLEQKGLIGYNPENHIYSINPRGGQVLRLSEELAEYLSPIDQMIKNYSFYIKGQHEAEHISSKKNAAELTMVTSPHV